MKVFRKVLIFILIHTYIMTNICCAQEILVNSDTLSPMVTIDSEFLMEGFTPNQNNNYIPKVLENYDPNILTLDNGDLSIAGRILIELMIIRHELNTLLTPVLAMPIDSEAAAMGVEDFEKIREMRKDLKSVNNALEDAFGDNNVPSIEAISEIIMQVNGLMSKYSGFVALKSKKTLGEKSSIVVNSGIDCLNIIIDHTNTVLFGAKQEQFDIKEIFDKEKEQKVLDVQGLEYPEVYGYRNGLSFIIKNLKYNVFEHAGSGYDIKIDQDEKNIIITFSDSGNGFDIESLRQKALELGYISPEFSAKARDTEIIDLIFEKYFSQRYEKGKTHGLGLWLSRQVIESYFKGTISAKNAKEHTGAVFTITIPRKITSKFRDRKYAYISLGIMGGISLIIGAVNIFPEFVSEAKEQAVVSIEEITGVNSELNYVINGLIGIEQSI